MLNKIRAFFRQYSSFIIKEAIKAFFLMVTAVIAVTFWEKQKVLNEVSFSKKIDIISDERKRLMEYTDRYIAEWNILNRTNKDCKSSATYNTAFEEVQRIVQKTESILLNSLIYNDALKNKKKELNDQSQIFYAEIKECKLDANKNTELITLYDEITEMYSEEINKNIK